MGWALSMAFFGLWLFGVLGREHAGLWEHLFLLGWVTCGALCLCLPD